MKQVLASSIAALVLLSSSLAFGQANTDTGSGTEKPKPVSADLESKFKETLTNAIMTGRWCSLKDGVLGPEKEDKYTIVGVTKLSGDQWLINARIQYNKQD